MKSEHTEFLLHEEEQSGQQKQEYRSHLDGKERKLSCLLPGQDLLAMKLYGDPKALLPLEYNYVPSECFEKTAPRGATPLELQPLYLLRDYLRGITLRES